MSVQNIVFPNIIRLLTCQRFLYDNAIQTTYRMNRKEKYQSMRFSQRFTTALVQRDQLCISTTKIILRLVNG